MACCEAPAGDIGKLSNEDIADWVGWTVFRVFIESPGAGQRLDQFIGVAVHPTQSDGH